MRRFYRLPIPAAGPLGWLPLGYKPSIVAEEERQRLPDQRLGLGMHASLNPVPMGGVLADGGAGAPKPLRNVVDQAPHLVHAAYP